jgi:hypothetical protein
MHTLLSHRVLREPSIWCLGNEEPPAVGGPDSECINHFHCHGLSAFLYFLVYTEDGCTRLHLPEYFSKVPDNEWKKVKNAGIFFTCSLFA